MSEVTATIDTIARTRQINMMDRFLVISKCKQLGYIDTAKWISQNPRAYAKLIIEGTAAPYSMTSKDGRLSL